MNLNGDMNLKIGSMLVCLLLLGGFVVAQQANATNETAGAAIAANVTNASEAAVKSAAVQARYENVKYGYEKTLVAMDAVIGYLSNKTDTSALAGLGDNFTSLFGGLQQYVDANDPSGFGKQVAEMHKIAAQFKSETAKLAAPGEMGNLRKLVQNRTDEKEKETGMKEIRERATEKKAKAYTLACDLNLGRLKAFADTISAQNVSADEIRNAGAQIRERCENITQVKNETELKQRIDALRDDFDTAEVKVIASARVANEKAMERATTVVNALENKGMNVSGAREKLAIVAGLKEEVRTACANMTAEQTREDCKAKIESLRNQTASIGEQIRVIRSNASEKNNVSERSNASENARSEQGRR